MHDQEFEKTEPALSRSVWVTLIGWMLPILAAKSQEAMRSPFSITSNDDGASTGSVNP
jgi:hypothetical protein